MANLVEKLLSKQYLVDYSREMSKTQFPLQELFPQSTIPFLDVKMFKGAKGTNINITEMAHIRDFDAIPEQSQRLDLSYDLADMMLVSREMPINEKEIIQLGYTDNDEITTWIRNNIYDDVDRLTMAVLARFELMRADALTKGKLEINENGFKTTIDYNMPKNHFGQWDWSTPESDPLKDIREAIRLIQKDSAITPTRILTTADKLDELCLHEKVRKDLLGSESEQVLGLNELNQLLSRKGYPTIAVYPVDYTGSYRELNKKGEWEVKSFLDPKTFLLLPPGKLGDTFFGPNADQIDMQQDPTVNAQQFGGVTTIMYRDVQRAHKYVRSSATGLVTFPYADAVYSATVQ